MKITYLKSTIILLILFLSFSCIDDILDKEPLSSVSAEGFYKTTSDAKAGVIGIYDAAQSAFRINFAYWGEGRADNVKTEQSGESLILIDNNLNESAASADWTILYRMVSRANYAIKYIPDVYEEDDSEGKQYIAQAKALRALAYFYLVRVWGDVPLITEPYKSIEQEIFVTKTDKETVLDFIEEDLKYAAANCVVKFNNDNDRIMFNQSSANALLTKVYMWRHKYNEAITTSELVLNSGLYSLVTTMDDWSKIFTNGYSNESIFEIGYNETETNSLRTLYAIGSYAIFTPSDKFRASYNAADLRIDHIYDVTVDDPKAIWKFFGKGFNDEDPSKSEQNIVLMRLPDIMLLRAEALNKIGGAGKAEALSLLNTIRERAGLTAYASEADANAKYGDLESAILHERSIELCFEGHRWFDLVRTGKAISTMQPLNGLSDERNLVWPIYTNVLNKNTNLVQNDYYR